MTTHKITVKNEVGREVNPNEKWEGVYEHGRYIANRVTDDWISFEQSVKEYDAPNIPDTKEEEFVEAELVWQVKNRLGWIDTDDHKYMEGEGFITRQIYRLVQQPKEQEKEKTAEGQDMKTHQYRKMYSENWVDCDKDTADKFTGNPSIKVREKAIGEIYIEKCISLLTENLKQATYSDGGINPKNEAAIFRNCGYKLGIRDSIYAIESLEFNINNSEQTAIKDTRISELEARVKELTEIQVSEIVKKTLAYVAENGEARALRDDSHCIYEVIIDDEQILSMQNEIVKHIKEAFTDH